jgi:Asp-tRNA(Asn)/Glu-tRNA(Gln) amidotransferase A subunit family amidase
MDDELVWMPGWRLAQLIAAGRLSPVDLTSQVLRRIDTLDPSLNAYLTVVPDTALEQARAAEDAVARGAQLGQLHGVPVSIKDSLWTKGIRTTCGSLHYERL